MRRLRCFGAAASTFLPANTRRSGAPAKRASPEPITTNRGYGFRACACPAHPGMTNRMEWFSMKQFVLYAASAFVLLLGTFAAHAADVAAGKEKAELCIGCHGENGVSQMENIPSLAGQQDQFIQWQLVYFRAGSRKNEQMQPIVEQLNNEDIRNLGAYFASLTPPPVAEGRQSGSVGKGQAGRRRPPLRLLPHRQFRWHQGGGAPHRPARGISVEGAARLQVRPARRRRPGRDGRRRLSLER